MTCMLIIVITGQKTFPGKECNLIMNWSKNLIVVACNKHFQDHCKRMRKVNLAQCLCKIRPALLFISRLIIINTVFVVCISGVEYQGALVYFHQYM